MKINQCFILLVRHELIIFLRKDMTWLFMPEALFVDFVSKTNCLISHLKFDNIYSDVKKAK